MLSPSLTNWRAQYERLVRSYERVNQPYKSSVAYNDDLQHYFQDCWHLKDWIKNDPSSGVGAAIETEVLAHKALRVVADLANGAKHLARHTHQEGAYLTSANVTVHLGQDKPIDVYYVVTLGDGTKISAQELVHEAYQAWSDVLNKLGLNS
jgi:hypothetical protein